MHCVMKITALNTLVAAATAALFSTSAFAARSAMTVPSSSTPGASIPTMTTTASGQSAGSILDKFYLNYFTTYKGGPLDNMGSNYTLDRTGKVNTTQKTMLDGTLTAAYMLDKDVGIGPVVPFLLIPGPGQHMVMGDAGIQLFNRATYSAHGLKVGANLIAQAPTSTESQNRNMSFAVKTTVPSVRYNVAHTNFAVGAWTEAKAYLGVTTGKTFKLFAEPYVSYSMTEHLALNVQYEMEANHYLGASTFDFTNHKTDLQPGFIWFITPEPILVNPYVQIFTGNKITVQNSALGAVLSATVL